MRSPVKAHKSERDEMAAKMATEYDREKDLEIEALRRELKSRSAANIWHNIVASISAAALIGTMVAGVKMRDELQGQSIRFGIMEVSVKKVADQVEKQREEETGRERRLNSIESQLTGFTKTFDLLVTQVGEYRKEQQAIAAQVMELSLQLKYNPSTKLPSVK